MIFREANNETYPIMQGVYSQHGARRRWDCRRERPAGMRHAGDPWYAKAWALIVAAYAFSPIDLAPDFIPVLGYLDDLLLVPLGVAVAIRLIPPAVLEECRAEARRARAAGRPTNWIAGIIILLLWLMFLSVIAKTVWSILH